MGQGKRKFHTKGKSLNVLLWFCFSLFALLIVVVYAVFQLIFVKRYYNDRLKDRMCKTGREVVSRIEESDTTSTVVGKIYEAVGENGTGWCLFYEDGTCLYPDIQESGSYRQIVEELSDLLESADEATFYYDSDLCYGTRLTVEGRNCLLLFRSPTALSKVYHGSFTLMLLVTGLLSVVIAFVVSGVVSAFITKPVTEVTEQAKELARGKYDLEFKHDYFCMEIRDLSDALDYARSEISKADGMQKELIANVSHDFKTPLTMIKAYASMIREISGEDKKKRDAHAQVIIDECDRLTALVGDLLDLSKLRAGLSSDMGSVFNLSEDVYRVASRFDYLVQTEGYRIETDVEDDIYAYACRERIEQVLYNLIGNAVNYTGEDKRVRMRLFRKGAAARFEVVDSGKGIPEDEIDTIWDRYYRSNSTHKRPVSGTGLGLTIVKNILLAQKCRFGVVSERGKGSCFWVEFPSPNEGKNELEEGDGVR